MAYTYDDFIRSAQQSGLYSQFSPWDLQLAQANPASGMQLLAAKQQWAGASDDAGRAAANQMAESIRSGASSFGQTSYSGGTWGNQYNPIQTTAPEWIGSGNSPQTQPQSPGYTPIQTPNFDTSAYQVQPFQSNLTAPAPYQQQYSAEINQALNALMNYKDFEWDRTAPEYVNQYQDLIAALHDAVVNRDSFSYDHETDPMFEAYAKQYRREGDRATQNALAAASMRTGGASSTAAVSAAAQAGDYYSSRLMDALPGLFQQSYDRYLGDYQMDVSKLDTTRGLEADDYRKHLTDLGQYNTDRDAAFSQWAQRYNQLQGNHGAALGSEGASLDAYRTNLGQYNADRNFEYGAYRDTADDAFRNQSFDYGMMRDGVGDQRYNNEFSYSAGRDALGDQRYADETAYSRERDAYERDMALAQLAAKYGDTSFLKNYGINPQLSGGSGGSKKDDGNGPKWLNEYETFTPGLGAATNVANTPKQENVYVEGFGWLDPASLQQLLYTGAVVEMVGQNGAKIYVAR